MNPDKAYVLGFVLGSATFGTSGRTVTLRLPLRQFGAVTNDDPNRAGQIAQDILRRLNPIFNQEYGIQLTYHQDDHEWTLDCTGNIQALADDLRNMGVNPAGELRKSADISGILPLLIDEEQKVQFLGGMADSIGSIAPSHRRFDEDHQIISFEFSGFNYMLVHQICRLFHDIGCYPDQVLWNHPNQHSGSDPYYRQWKKGFKLRILLQEFMAKGSFLFKSKIDGARANIERQSIQQRGEPCTAREVRMENTVCIHSEQSSSSLPEKLRGVVVVHHKQVCAILGCPYAPVAELKEGLKEIEHMINPFPILSKGDRATILNRIKANPIMKNRKYRKLILTPKSASKLLDTLTQDGGTLLFGVGDAGYPVNQVLQAIAYVIAASKGNTRGNRVVGGSYTDVISEAIRDGSIDGITIRVPDKFTPLFVEKGNHAALVGPNNPKVYRRLLIYESPFSIKVRQIEEDDL